MIEHDAVISEYEHEKFRPREAEALQSLRKIASLVKPIMRQRGWKVGVLTEFWPEEKNLLGLNWNRGQKICLRLRYPGDERQFLPIEDVTDTMLHELCHIVHGPHNEAFHNLWNQLRSEHEQLIRKGYTGEGFLSKGHKLGGATRIPMHEARRKARAAAEKRRNLTAGSGQKLGGAPVLRGQDIRRVIADAATRRITVTKGCASGSDRSRSLVEETTRNGFRTKADEENANEEAIMQAYIEMIQDEEREKYGASYIPPSSTNPAGSQGQQGDPSSVNPAESASRIPSDTKSSPPPKTDPVKDPSDPEDRSTSPRPASPSNSWTCGICTLQNPQSFLCCDACGTERSSPSFDASPAQSSKQHKLSQVQKPLQHSIPNHNPLDQKRKTLATLSTLDAAIDETRNKKPMGWLCHRCGNFMENEWWTCSGCGSMRQSS